ncbi:gamma-butyrobetaine hydroxylase-like domain-containing protein [Gilvimarinus sp. DA14]|uniref:gamma-butyrobetaine hydroxylase-like domain-containing protein n=1 Tax=Gilvimarinus sp. DA14 TaxID=2956798 RepID=UPI0020B6AB3B|nr:DUF971 domain-containing protein [Gilvimarinus sp. DA14]UTF61671.1 DUF971 domain-containing protein [Gilvimarinus sp. DA14]
MQPPRKIKLHRDTAELEIQFGDESYRLSAEFLRVHSPSAEVKGHGPGQAVLQHGKKDVAITSVAAVGNYAIGLTFSDGHDSGIYTWEHLKDFTSHKEAYWQQYLDALNKAGLSRDPHTSAVKLV